jgi:hypothetical protein
MGHGRTYEVVDKETLYVTPAKILALTCVDLLCDGAAEARKIVDSFKPTIPRAEYVEFMRKLVG